MKLSMWILADWLEQYAPVCKIEDGQRILRNVRIFSEGLKLSRTTVYLSVIDDKSIMCSNGHDIMTVQCDDIHQIFNAILDGFEYYNEWSSTLHGLIDDGCPMTELLSAGQKMLNRYLILADATFFVRETVGDLEEFMDNEEAVNNIRNRLMPLDVILNINRLKKIRIPSEKAYIVETPDSHLCSSVTNLFSGGEHKGWIVTMKSSCIYSNGEMDLQAAYTEVFNLWLEKNDSYDRQLEKTAIFLKLLQGENLSDEKVYERLSGFRWNIDDRKVIYVIRQMDTSKNPKHIIDGYLKRLNSDSFVIHFNGILVYIVNLTLTSASEYEEFLIRILRQCGCVAGRSPVFTDIMCIKSYYQAAELAAGHIIDRNNPIIMYDEIRLKYALSLIKEHAVAETRHPAIRILEEYDLKHNTNFKETVFTLLKHACSYTETASALNIHRTTLLYRIERIRHLTNIDLDDHITRFHLLMTYLLEEIV